jgi:tRNA-dihydrouridine synthase
LEAKEHLVKGLKPFKIEVSVKGRIDGACKGENNWDETLRSIGPCVLDVFIVHVRDQNLTYMVDLCG